MGGRAWSQEELIRLEELTETYPLATVARKLNRSENAVFLKRQRTGIGGFMANTDMLTRNTLSRILGVENRTIQYWERKGLKSVRKNPYVMYRQQDIIRYMKEHPEDWNAARVTDDTLFMQYPWFKEKRKNDISHKYNWTQTEVSQMKMLRKQGFTIREIAEKMNRQVKETSKSKVSNRHDGYGIASEFYAGMKLDQKKVDESMKDFPRILPTEDDAKAVEAASSLKNAATGLVLQATKLAAQADRIMHDLYDEVSSYTTPVEDYLEGQFEDAEADPEAEAEEEQEDAE